LLKVCAAFVQTVNSALLIYKVTQKTGTLKNPTKIEEIQQKNFIDRN